MLTFKWITKTTNWKFQTPNTPKAIEFEHPNLCFISQTQLNIQVTFKSTHNHEETKLDLYFKDCGSLKLRIPIRTPSPSHQKRRKMGIEMERKITWSWIHHCMLDLGRKSPKIITGRGKIEWKRKREGGAHSLERKEWRKWWRKKSKVFLIR